MASTGTKIKKFKVYKAIEIKQIYIKVIKERKMQQIRRAKTKQIIKE